VAAIYTQPAMSKDKEAKEPTETRIYDRRTVERNIKRGVISRKDYEKHVKSLPDAADKVRPTDN
jgi:hypothetical protein